MSLLNITYKSILLFSKNVNVRQWKQARFSGKALGIVNKI